MRDKMSNPLLTLYPLHANKDVENNINTNIPMHLRDVRESTAENGDGRYCDTGTHVDVARTPNDFYRGGDGGGCLETV